MKRIGSRFGDDTDLPAGAGAGAVLRRVVARVDPEFLDIFDTGLQTERGRKFAVQVARIESMIAEPSIPSNLIAFCSLERPLNRMSKNDPLPVLTEPGACR